MRAVRMAGWAGWNQAVRLRDHSRAAECRLDFATAGWNWSEHQTVTDAVAEFLASPDADICLGLGDWDGLEDGLGEWESDPLRDAVARRAAMVIRAAECYGCHVEGVRCDTEDGEVVEDGRPVAWVSSADAVRLVAGEDGHGAGRLLCEDCWAEVMSA